MVPGAAVGSPRVAYAAAARGMRAVTTRYRKHGYPAAHPVIHLRLLAAHAVGGLGARAPSEAACRAGYAARSAGANAGKTASGGAGARTNCALRTSRGRGRSGSHHDRPG